MNTSTNTKNEQKLVEQSDEEIGDHDVTKIGNHLDGKSIALLVSGGIAAYKIPSLARHFRQYGAEVQIYITESAKDYVGIKALEWASINNVVEQLSFKSEHLFKHDAYVAAPLTYNTLGKFANGIADNPVTTAFASGFGKMESGNSKILLVPTMHGSMMNSMYRDNLERLVTKGALVIQPELKMGKANLPSSHEIVVNTIRALSTSPLQGEKLLLTAGPTPGWLDNVRYITNKFRGRSGLAIAEEAYLRGMDIDLVIGSSGIAIPKYLNTTIVHSYNEYRQTVMDLLDKQAYDIGIFSAAVADYIPSEVKKGKIPSHGGLTEIPLVETAKVIQEVRQKYPDLFMVTFKYQEQISHEELEQITMNRIAQGYQMIVANRGEEMTDRVHRSHIYSSLGKIAEGNSKSETAKTLLDALEATYSTNKHVGQGA